MIERDDAGTNDDRPSDAGDSEQFVPTSDSRVFATQLPDHWRANRALPYPFRVFVNTPDIKSLDMTEVEVLFASSS